MLAKSILILDDEPQIRETLSDFFSDKGCAATCCENGQQALSALRGGAFDLAIVDVRLTDMDGFSFIAQAVAVQPGLRFIVYTGSMEYIAADNLDAMQHTVAAVIIKPVADMQLFLDILEQEPDSQ